MIFKKNSELLKYAALIFVATFVLSSVLFSVPKKAEAVTFFTIELPAGAEAIKEYVLDPLVNAIGVALVRTMSDNIQNWVRGGFDGKPLFVTDWEGFLQKAGNEAFGLYMDDLIRRGAPDICSPFRSDVILGLLSTGSRQRARCTLDRVVANVNSIYNNFETYGWTGYASITTANVSNNAFGSFLLQMDQTQRAIAQKTLGLQQEAQASRGFLSWKECIERDETETDRPCISSRTVTPGSYVANKLNLPDEYSAIKLAVGDEFNELISVVAQQLLNNALSGSRPGGVTRPSSTPPPNYSELIGQQQSYLSSVVRSELINPETQYVEAKQTSANTLAKTIATLQELEKCQTNSRGPEITQNRDALERIKTEFNLADIKLERYENMLKDVLRTADPVIMGNLAQTIVSAQRETRTGAEIDSALSQASLLQTNLDARIAELKSCGPSRQFLTLSAFPSFITSGRSSILSWSSINLTSCSASGTGWSGAKPVSGDQKVFPARTSGFQLNCSGASGTLSATTTIIVSP